MENRVPDTRDKPDFLLLPGGWCGSWCWEPVARLLRQAGHRVFSVTYTGVGERSHLLSHEITMETHVLDVINTIRFADLDDFILVAHSLGGIPAAITADRIPRRIRRMVFLDAMVLESGECAFDLIPADIVKARLAASEDGGISMPVPRPKHPLKRAAHDSPESFLQDSSSREWFWEHMTPHPLRPYSERIVLNGPVGNNLPVTYISCIPSQIPAIRHSKHRAQERGWPVVEIVSSHNAHLQKPEEVAALLRQCTCCCDIFNQKGFPE